MRAQRTKNRAPDAGLSWSLGFSVITTWAGVEATGFLTLRPHLSTDLTVICSEPSL